MVSEISLRVKTPSGDVIDAPALIGTADRSYTLEVDLAGLGTRHIVGPDLFEFLACLRTELEALGYRTLVNGARRNVWPSGMARDMGGGRKAYVLMLGKQASRPDMVDIFEPAPESEIALVQEQEAFQQAWFAQFRPPPGIGGPEP
jgi:hypothetical protein